MRQLLAQAERAAAAAKRAGSAAAELRVGIVDASYDSMPQILRQDSSRISPDDGAVGWVAQFTPSARIRVASAVVALHR